MVRREIWNIGIDLRLFPGGKAGGREIIMEHRDREIKMEHRRSTFTIIIHGSNGGSI